MSTSMGISGGDYPAGAVWLTRLTYEDGHTEDVETVAGPDGSYSITVPEGVVKAGPSWMKDERPGNDYPASDAPAPAPVTFVIPGVTYGGGGGTR